MVEKNRESPAEHEPTRREFLKKSAVGGAAGLLAPRAGQVESAAHQSELRANWRNISAREVSAPDGEVSKPTYDASHWHPVHRMPATVLQPREGAGVYKDLYFGMNLTKTMPSDLWKQD